MDDKKQEFFISDVERVKYKNTFLYFRAEELISGKYPVGLPRESVSEANSKLSPELALGFNTRYKKVVYMGTFNLYKYLLRDIINMSYFFNVNNNQKYGF